MYRKKYANLQPCSVSILELGSGMCETAQMLYIYQLVVKISIDIVAVALQRFQSGIIYKIYQNVPVSAAMPGVPVPVFSVLVEEYHDACLPVDQTPHVRLTFHVNGTVAQPGLVHVYVGTFAQCDLLQCGYQPVELYRSLVRPVQKVLRRSQSISANRFLASLFAGVASGSG